MIRQGQALIVALIGIVVLLAAAAMIWIVLAPASPPPVPVLVTTPVSVATPVSTTSTGPAPLTDDERSEAEDIYTLRCAACHAPDGSGMVGPSLIDDTWIHGRDLDVIRRGLVTGYPKQGMPSQKDALSESEMDLVARYVLEMGEDAP